ncbi:MAG: PD-(D/E)XK nuclease family protein, partial [Oscillospiraceae bacterium]|nr:PD-(D/E)XK nuclease family protein [Oscillospiraceae bacterium]
VRAQLYALAQDAGVPCVEEVLPAAPVRDALSHVERCFFGARKTWTGESGEIHLYEASDIYAEAEWAASEILRLVRGGFRFRDITVAARNLSEYEPILETVFSRYGVPLYSARRRDILQEQVLTLLLGALDAVAGDFEYEDVFRCLKTGLAGISSEECDVLENYVLKWEIRGSMWTRDTAWTAHPEGYGARWDDESRARLEQVNALRERVRGPFVRLAQGIRGRSAAAEKVRALYGYLEELAVPEQLQQLTAQRFAAQDTQRAEELAQLWSILCGVMDQFVSILGTHELDAEEFARLFRLVLTQYSVGTIPAALDQVSCSEITRNDRHSVGVLFLLGANDGVLPKADGSSGVLKEEDRLALEQQDIRLSPYGMAQFHLEIQNLYAALAQPTHRLCVSYPLFDAKGSELRPSFVVGRLQAICPAVKLEKESAEKEYRLSAKLPALEVAASHIGGEIWQYFAQNGTYQDRLAAMEAAAHYSRGRLSPEVVRSLYGQRIGLSASRIDKARACHFAFFMQYGLRAKERSSAGFDAPQSGTFVHDVMEGTLRRAEEAGGLKTLDTEALHRMVRLSIEEFIERELPDLGEKTARFRYLFDRLCESVYRIMDEVADELRNSDFVPLAFELGFGAGGELPAITVRDGAREVRVDGRVDRVDGWLQDGRLYLRVVDYKTGRKSFDLADLRYGLGIQMLLYLFALEREGRGYFGHEIVPAGVLYTPTRDPIVPGARGMTDEQIKAALRRNLRRSGMVLDDPRVLQAMEHSALEEPCYLPVTAKRDKEGKLLLGGSLASSEQLGKLGQYVDHLLRRIAREMAAGNIDADPYARSPQDTACTYCPFAPACHFTPGQGRDHLEYIRSVKNGEFWSDLNETLTGEEAQEHA